MREVKYMAWHKQERKMYEVSVIYFGVQYGMGPNERANLVLLSDGSTYYRDDEEVDLLEYTGIKDISDKDIYESFIVRHVTHRFNGVVFFDRGCFWVREYLSQTDAGLYNDIEKETRWSIDLDWEVVGNQYENPELIQVKL